MIYDMNSTVVTEAKNGVDEKTDLQEKDEDKSWIDKMIGKVKESVSDAGEKAKEILNRFIDVKMIIDLMQKVILFRNMIAQIRHNNINSIHLEQRLNMKLIDKYVKLHDGKEMDPLIYFIDNENYKI